MDSQDEAERRRAGRVQTKGMLRAQLSMDAEVLALSARGMMIFLTFAPDVGSRHSFTLAFPERVISVLGTVRNADPIEDKERSGYRVGVEFEAIERSEETFIESFVASKLQS